MNAELKELEREIENRDMKLSWFFESRPESIPLPGIKLGSSPHSLHNHLYSLENSWDFGDDQNESVSGKGKIESETTTNEIGFNEEDILKEMIIAAKPETKTKTNTNTNTNNKQTTTTTPDEDIWEASSPLQLNEKGKEKIDSQEQQSENTTTNNNNNNPNSNSNSSPVKTKEGGGGSGLGFRKKRALGSVDKEEVEKVFKPNNVVKALTGDSTETKEGRSSEKLSWFFGIGAENIPITPPLSPRSENPSGSLSNSGKISTRHKKNRTS